MARLVVLAALALLTSACAYRTQAPVRSVAQEPVESAIWDEPFGVSPSRPSPDFVALAAARADGERASLTDASSPSLETDDAAGIGAKASTVTQELDATETEEVVAAPGSACYEAALQAGLVSGTCTIVYERKYILVGEKGE